MRCNIFKPINGGDNRMGTFLMFSQYTEDITKEQTSKSTYRVIPSKFVALNLNIDNVFNHNSELSLSAHIDNNSGNYSMNIGEKTVVGVNNIIPQIFQSYFENSNAALMDELGDTGWNISGRSYASELLWHTLKDWGFIGEYEEDDEHLHISRVFKPSHYKDDTNGIEFDYYDEIKYIGDINIHSNHKVGAYSYDEIFCHIPAKTDEYYYPLMNLRDEDQLVQEVEADSLDQPLNGWTDATYPTDYPLVNRAIKYHDDSCGYLYRTGGIFPILDNTGLENKPVPRNTGKENVEYNFNAIIIFYDVLESNPGEDPQYIHRFRPMGIYLSGPVVESNGKLTLQNTFTKYVTNNDAYGQGASFGLRIMSRYTPTPNMTSNVIEVESDSGDYEVITQAMGGIADAIININGICKDQKAMYQSFKDHLAQFRNRRVNIPYIREVNGKPYWFVNGRNTNQPVYPEYTPTPDPEPSEEITREELLQSIIIEPANGGMVEIIETPNDVVNSINNNNIDGNGHVVINN